jgi:hypothetical protein
MARVQGLQHSTLIAVRGGSKVAIVNTKRLQRRWSFFHG